MKKRRLAAGSSSKKSIAGKKSTGINYENSVNAASRKRARLMSFPGNVAETKVETGNQEIVEFREIENEPVHKKVIVKKEIAGETIDIQQRAENAREMESEVSLKVQTQSCVVHKGPIEGLSYTCKTCGTVYCIRCVEHLMEHGEKCWNCQSVIEIDVKKPADIIKPVLKKASVSLFSDDVWKKINELHLDEEIYDEVIEQLKQVPPQQRIKYIEDKFRDIEKAEDEF